MDDGAPRVLTLQVGLPQVRRSGAGIGRKSAEWYSGIFKEAVGGPVWLGPTGFDGDGQADLKAHGGPHKAVLLYAASHYPDWRERLDKPELAFGGFGENLTIEGQTEDSVCIGDVYDVGEAQIEICQPRIPCWKLSRRQDMPDLMEQVQQLGRGGWYARVLRTGHIRAGQSLRLVARPNPAFSITTVNDVVYRRESDPDTRAALAQCPALAPGLQQMFAQSRKQAAD